MKIRISLLPLSAIGLLACVGCRKTTSTSSPETPSAADVTGSVQDNPNQIVVTQRTAVFAETDAKSKSLAVVQAGETLVFLGDSAQSSSGKDESFYKVKLSDGTVGWARNYGLILGNPGAVLVETPIYQRPTILASTRGKLPLGQLVGVQGEQDGFLKVAASRWQTGWVPKSDISTDSSDVLAAALAGPAMAKKSGKTALLAGLSALAGRPSNIAKALQSRLDSLNGPDTTAMVPVQSATPVTDSVKQVQ